MIDAPFSVEKFPAPAVNVSATIDSSAQNPSTSCSVQAVRNENNSNRQETKIIQLKPGTLPDCANELSNAARALLLRLLDIDSKVRLRNIRQLQQTAFYMKFNFEHIKAKKISPKLVLERHVGYDLSQNVQNNLVQNFIEFDQPMLT